MVDDDDFKKKMDDVSMLKLTKLLQLLCLVLLVSLFGIRLVMHQENAFAALALLPMLLWTMKND